MASIFNALGIGYSGLNASQVAINTTSHNIANANTDGYSRQTVITQVAPPINTIPGSVGNGTQVNQIARIFDQFTFNSYSSASADKSASDFTQSNLQQLSTYFPDLSGSGISEDLQSYYSQWQSLADNPGNSSIQTALAQQTQSVTQDVQGLYGQVTTLQSQLNDQLKTNIDEVNTLGQQIANLNSSISQIQSAPGVNANDLLDQRNTLELSLSKLIGATVSNGKATSNTSVNANLIEDKGSDSVTVGGFNIVDGSTFHPIVIDNTSSASGMYSLYYQRQDGTKLSMNNSIAGGQIGAILNLRGSTLDASGNPTNGVLQGVKDQLNMFAAGLIQSTNNVYSQTPTTSMQSNPMNVSPTTTITNSGMGVNKGSFNVIVYDASGNQVATRTINIDDLTTFGGTAGTDSIEGQINAQKDDNKDGNATNDVNSILSASSVNGVLSFNLNSSYATQGYSFSIQDNLGSSGAYNSGTNFAGALGMNKFFTGTNASNIALNSNLQSDPTQISAGVSPVSGDNQVATQMVQSQFENVNFKKGDSTTYTDTISGMYNMIATNVGTQANAAVAANGTITAKYNATQQQYDSVSSVSMDEEMTNLIKYQTAYGASAKIITTIDQMMTTLLGIKQ